MMKLWAIDECLMKMSPRASLEKQTSCFSNRELGRIVADVYSPLDLTFYKYNCKIFAMNISIKRLLHIKQVHNFT